MSHTFRYNMEIDELIKVDICCQQIYNFLLAQYISYIVFQSINIIQMNITRI